MTGWRRGKCDCCGDEVCGCTCSPVVDAGLADVTINHPATTVWAIGCTCNSETCECEDNTDPDQYTGYSTSVPGWSKTARSAGGCGQTAPAFGDLEMIYDCVDIDTWGDGHYPSLSQVSNLGYAECGEDGVSPNSVALDEGCCGSFPTAPESYAYSDRWDTDSMTYYCGGGWGSGIYRRRQTVLKGLGVKVSLHPDCAGEYWWLLIVLYAASSCISQATGSPIVTSNDACSSNYWELLYRWPCEGGAGLNCCFTTKRSTDADVELYSGAPGAEVNDASQWDKWKSATSLVNGDKVDETYMWGIATCQTGNYLTGGPLTVVPELAWTARSI